MSTPRTTVITLTCDRPAYLAEAIASVEAQTDQDLEHFVYDLASSDPAVERIVTEAAVRRSGRFRYCLAADRGPDAVGLYWNYMLKEARGRYVTILDDDNRKRADFVARMIAPMEADAAVDAVTCGMAIIDGRGELTGEERHLNLETSIPRLWRDNTIDSNAVCFRRSVVDRIGAFDPTLTTNEDWEWVIRLVRQCRVEHLPDALLEYRVHDSARSRRAVALGAHANWHAIRKKHFSPAEWREAIAMVNASAKK